MRSPTKRRMSMPTKIEAMIQAGIPKKNGASGFSAAKIASITVPRSPSPISAAVGRSPMIETNSVGATVMATMSLVNRIRPTISSTMCPKYQKKKRVMSTQALVGGVAIGQVRRRQISNWRTADGWKTSLANHSMLTAYRNIEMMPEPTRNAVVVTSMLPSLNQPSRERGPGMPKLNRCATSPRYWHRNAVCSLCS